MHIPLILINGSLGSGKTTLVKQLLSQPEYSSSMLIENEYASVNIDRQIVAEDHHDSVVEISGSCICCSTGEELEEALALLVGQGWDRPVILEATGMANSAKLLQRLFLNPMFLQHYEIAQTILLIDPLENNGTLTDELKLEIKLSDLIIINKSDLADKSTINNLQQEILKLNDVAKVVVTDHSQYLLSAPSQLESNVEQALVANAVSIEQLETEAALPYTVIEPVPPLDIDELVKRIRDNAESAGIRRLKGFVQDLQGKSWLLEATGKHAGLKPSDHKQTILVAIGSGANRDNLRQELGL